MRLALFLDDRLRFTQALLALWSEGHQVVLPGDVLPQTLAALAPHVDGWVGDFPGVSTQPLPAPRVVDWRSLELERELLVVFTSGSTGAPTAISKTLRQLFDEVATLEATFGARLDPGAKVFATVSHQHIYGLLFAVLWPLTTGRALTAVRLEYPEQLEAVLAPEPCVLISSPAHLKRLPDVPRWTTRLQAIFSSGGPLSAEGAGRALAVLGQQAIEVFGSSETGGIAWRQGQENPWAPLAGVDFRVSPEGTLEVSSPHLPTRAWFTTADRVELEGSAFRLLGRADRIAKIEEKRVSLELIERTALSTGLLTEARVVPLQGLRLTLGLVGVLSAEGRALERKVIVERLKAALAGAIERVALPRRFRFVEALPVNEQGKPTEARLVPLFSPERPTPTWQARSATAASGAMTITRDLRVLDGHFPGTPVVPGVAQLDWAIGWGRELFGFSAPFKRVDALKFQRLMVPGHEVQLELEWSAERSTLTFKFSSPRGVYSSGKVVWGP